jgi:hypothetical protein
MNKNIKSGVIQGYNPNSNTSRLSLSSFNQIYSQRKDSPDLNSLNEIIVKCETSEPMKDLVKKSHRIS